MNWWARLDLNLSRLAGVSEARARWRNPERSEGPFTLKPYPWWARLDLNQEPTDYESAALTVELRARVNIIIPRGRML